MKCESCDGTGMQGVFSLNDQPATLCQDCVGTGEKKDEAIRMEKENCPECDGKGLVWVPNGHDGDISREQCPLCDSSREAPYASIAYSESLKQQGMESAMDANPTNLQIGRSIARELCLRHGSTTADEVGRLLWKRHRIESLGPAGGSLFKGGDFEPTGKMRKSSRKKNHARLLFVWQLKGDS